MPGFLSDPFPYRDVPGTRPAAIRLGDAVVSGRVRFYDPAKGYGFVETGDGDAYLAADVLTAFGLDTVAPGTTIRMVTSHGATGLVAHDIVEIDDATASAPARKTEHRGSGSERTASGSVTAWREDKGFGFVETDEGDTTCGMGSDDKAYCWGYNGSYASEDGTTDTRYVPTRMLIPAGVAGLASPITGTTTTYVVAR